MTSCLPFIWVFVLPWVKGHGHFSNYEPSHRTSDKHHSNSMTVFLLLIDVAILQDSHRQSNVRSNTASHGCRHSSRDWLQHVVVAQSEIQRWVDFHKTHCCFFAVVGNTEHCDENHVSFRESCLYESELNTYCEKFRFVPKVAVQSIDGQVVWVLFALHRTLLWLLAETGDGWDWRFIFSLKIPFQVTSRQIPVYCLRFVSKV